MCSVKLKKEVKGCYTVTVLGSHIELMKDQFGWIAYSDNDEWDGSQFSTLKGFREWVVEFVKGEEGIKKEDELAEQPSLAAQAEKESLSVEQEQKEVDFLNEQRKA